MGGRTLLLLCLNIGLIFCFTDTEKDVICTLADCNFNDRWITGIGFFNLYTESDIYSISSTCNEIEVATKLLTTTTTTTTPTTTTTTTTTTTVQPTTQAPTPAPVVPTTRRRFNWRFTPSERRRRTWGK